MELMFATRSGNTINTIIEIANGYTAPFVYHLSGNNILPAANTNPLGDKIIEYYNTQNSTVQAAWNTSPYDVSNLSIVSTTNFPSTPSGIAIAISKKQFFEQLAIDGIVTEQEAAAAFGGTIPQTFQTYIESLPANVRFSTTLTILGGQSYKYDSPFITNITKYFGWDNERFQTFWTSASKL